ncbi:MAG TPA: hypothetical protein VI408_00900, partial [Gaiellaceae bacterium]
MENRPPPATVQLRPLPLMEKRVVGGPVPERVLAAYFGVALLAWIGAGIAVVRAAPDLARAAPFSGRVILAAHLVALGVLPFAVAGASFHLLPVMLRRDLPSPRALWLALLLLVGGPAVAFGLSNASRTTTWAGAALVACGLAVVVVELGWIVLRAPHDRTLIASRLGVTLSLAHAALALCLGAFVFDRPVHDFGRRVVAHLHLALVGWIALLVLTVGRNLAPMLAQAPAAPRRRLPVDEVVLVAGLWILVAGILDGSRLVTLVGGAVVVATIARFGTLLVRTY